MLRSGRELGHYTLQRCIQFFQPRCRMHENSATLILLSIFHVIVDQFETMSSIPNETILKKNPLVDSAFLTNVSLHLDENIGHQNNHR